MLHKIVCAFSVWLAFPVAAAYAAGIEFPDNGALAIGRGGAYAADPVDGLALSYNPAGFAKQKGVRITLDSKLSRQNVGFDPTGGKDDAVQSSNSPFFAPGAVVSYGLGRVGPLSGLTFALGAVGPSAVGKQSFPEDGKQRYSLIQSDMFIAYYSAAVAASWSDWLSVGATFQLAHGTATFSQAAFGLDDPTPYPRPGKDVMANIDVESGFIPTGIVGVTVRPHKQWSVGASYRPRLRFSGSGTLDSTLPDVAKTLAHLSTTGKDAALSLMFPDVVRLGVQYRPTSRWLIELNGVYEGWSVMDNITVTPKNIVVQQTDGSGANASVQWQRPLDPIVIQKNFKDAYSVRLGADYAVIPDRLTVRGGYTFETSAIPSEYVAVDFANWGRHMVAAGVSACFWGVMVDVAYAHHFVPTQKVNDSQVVQVTTPSPAGRGQYATPSVVGNGTYTASLDVVSLALRIPIDELRLTF
jgi:long-subunit fatty acid transport protein